MTARRKSTINPKVVEMTLTALLVAIIVLLTFTPLGYLKTPLFEITLMVLPVAVGSVVLGWKAGSILGAVFGITSYMTCFGIGMPSALGAFLLSENPVLTAVICIVPRILCGVLPALIYKAITQKDKHGYIAIAVSSLSTAIINTVLFLGGVWLVFSDFLASSDYGAFVKEGFGEFNVLTFFLAFASINALIEAGVCLVAGTAISKALLKVKERFL